VEGKVETGADPEGEILEGGGGVMTLNVERGRDGRPFCGQRWVMAKTGNQKYLETMRGGGEWRQLVDDEVGDDGIFLLFL